MIFCRERLKCTLMRVSCYDRAISYYGVNGLFSINFMLFNWNLDLSPLSCARKALYATRKRIENLRILPFCLYRYFLKKNIEMPSMPFI